MIDGGGHTKRLVACYTNYSNTMGSSGRFTHLYSFQLVFVHFTFMGINYFINVAPNHDTYETYQNHPETAKGSEPIDWGEQQVTDFFLVSSHTERYTHTLPLVLLVSIFYRNPLELFTHSRALSWFSLGSREYTFLVFAHHLTFWLPCSFYLKVRCSGNHNTDGGIVSQLVTELWGGMNYQVYPCSNSAHCFRVLIRCSPD